METNYIVHSAIIKQWLTFHFITSTNCFLLWPHLHCIHWIHRNSFCI